MYNGENGFYPQGQYLVGEDIPPGSYIFTSIGEDKGEIRLFSTYKKFEAQEETVWESFYGQYHMPLRKEGVYLLLENATMQRV